MEKFNENYEIIFIDDGSTDNSFKILEKLYKQNRKIKIIKFRRNFGQTAALNVGFKNANCSIIITMDADCTAGRFIEQRAFDMLLTHWLNRLNPICRHYPSRRRGGRKRTMQGPVSASVPVRTRASQPESIIAVLNMTERCDDREFELWELEFIELLGNIAGSAIHSADLQRSNEYARNSIVIALATLAEYRDNETGFHVERVMRLAIMLAEEMGRWKPPATRSIKSWLPWRRKARRPSCY